MGYLDSNGLAYYNGKLNNKFLNYLPLTGGTMSGGIVFTGAGKFLEYANDTDGVSFYGGQGNGHGARLSLYGKDAANSGSFFIRADDGTTPCSLTGSSDRTLDWGGNNFILHGNNDAAVTQFKMLNSDNSKCARINYLPNNGMYFELWDETNSTNNGARIAFRPNDHSDTAKQGRFEIDARSSSATKSLIGSPDGTLNWSGEKFVMFGDSNKEAGFALTSFSNTPKANIDLGWNWANRDGACIALRSSLDGGNGDFHIIARDATNSVTLRGRPNGVLDWNGTTLNFSNTNSHIDYTGSQATYSMIRFLNNANDTYGNGISIGGGGAVVVGGGEAATAMQTAVASNGGSELLVLCNDGNVDVYSNCQNGASSAYHYTFGANGVLTLPKASQVSSDKRLKQDISNIPDNILDSWDKVDWSLFKYKVDVQNDGDECDYHVGLIAQDVRDIGNTNNVDLCKYGVLYHNTQDGEDSWSVSYIEALAIEAAYQRRRADRLEARIEALERAING